MSLRPSSVVKFMNWGTNSCKSLRITDLVMCLSKQTRVTCKITIVETPLGRGMISVSDLPEKILTNYPHMIL